MAKAAKPRIDSSPLRGEEDLARALVELTLDSSPLRGEEEFIACAKAHAAAIHPRYAGKSSRRRRSASARDSSPLRGEETPTSTSRTPGCDSSPLRGEEAYVPPEDVVIVIHPRYAGKRVSRHHSSSCVCDSSPLRGEEGSKT